MRALLVLASLTMVSACSEDAPPMQPAPPTDRNFTATVNDRPVVGGTQRYECQIRARGAAGAQQYLLTFTDDLGHTIQVGIERGDDAPGARTVVGGMATATGLAYGLPQDAQARLTAIAPTAGGAVVSGRFDARFEVANAAPGVEARDPLIVRDAIFEQVECLDPAKAGAAGG